LSLSTLFEPLTTFVIPIAALLCFLSSNGGREQALRPTIRCVALLAGAGLGFGLLMLAASLSYDVNAAARHVGRHLAERAAFTGMDVRTWVTALIVPIPLVGDWLQPLFSDAAQGVGTTRTGSIAGDGMIRLFEAGMAKGGSPWGAVQWLIGTYMAGQIGTYLWSLPPMTSRGIWAGGGVVALFGLFHVRRTLAYARVENRVADLLIVALPILALLVVNTLLTGNAYWLNPMLPFVYCYAIAYVASGI
jgi:hypothetical protein